MSSPSDPIEQGAAPSTSFRVGKGIGIVSDTTLVLLEPVNGALAERLWGLVVADAAVDELLEELSSTGLRSLGSFAMARFEGSATRIVIRGTARADIVAGEVAREIGAPEVRTWVEELLDGATSITLRLGDSVVDELPFRVLQGLVPADALHRGLGQAVALVDLDTGWVDDFRVHDVFLDPPAVSDWHPTADLVPPEAAPAEIAPAETDPARTIASADYLERGSSGPTAEQQPAAEVEYDYDAIYGRTVSRSVQSAAVHLPEEDPAAHDSVAPVIPPMPAPDSNAGSTPSIVDPPPSSPMIDGVPSAPGSFAQQGDHDGLTMTKAQIQAMRASLAGGQPPATDRPGSMGAPSVQAVLCPAQHPNPPQESICRVCQRPLSSAPVLIARPVLVSLRFSTGATVAVDRPILIGRNPKLEGTLTSEIPNLVKLDVGQGLSRTHASVKLAGWQVLLEDLNSANGTIVTLPGRAARRLHVGEPVLLEVGTLIDFGGEISCVVEAV